jgi:hypothetical protein
MHAGDALAITVEVGEQGLILDDVGCYVVERLVKDWSQDIVPELEDPNVR